VAGKPRNAPRRQRPKLDFDYQPIRARLRYLCDLMFGGSHAEMASALNVCSRHFQAVIRDDKNHRTLTVRMVAQIITRLGVDAEWFLTGVGPVFSRKLPVVALDLPFAVQSSFPLLEPLEETPPVLPPPAFVPCDAISAMSDPDAVYGHAALSIFAANGQRCPVALLLGADALCEPTPELSALNALSLFAEQYCHFFGLSLAAARADIYPAITSGSFDLNRVAVLAANAGRGYAETIASWAFREQTRRQQSLLAAVYDLGVPVSVFAEIGEIPEHRLCGIRGAEVGAAVGAAAYVDGLVFTRYCQRFAELGGGVVICAGELHRWFALLDRALPQLPRGAITVIALNTVGSVLPPLVYPCTKICVAAGNPVLFFSHLIAACRAVYKNGGAVA
jgi:hypothetical protein